MSEGKYGKSRVDDLQEYSTTGVTRGGEKFGRLTKGRVSVSGVSRVVRDTLVWQGDGETRLEGDGGWLDEVVSRGTTRTLPGVCDGGVAEDK